MYFSYKTRSSSSGSSSTSPFFLKKKTKLLYLYLSIVFKKPRYWHSVWINRRWCPIWNNINQLLCFTRHNWSLPWIIQCDNHRTSLHYKEVELSFIDKQNKNWKFWQFTSRIKWVIDCRNANTSLYTLQISKFNSFNQFIFDQ